MQTDLNKKVAVTSAMDKERQDTLIAKYILACNIPFPMTEYVTFIEMVTVLRPGYKPPTRKSLCGHLHEPSATIKGTALWAGLYLDKRWVE